jgi:anti-sigma regulatory factor (Ser/Thr protein kinase)
MRQDIRTVLALLMASGEPFSSADVAKGAHASRQAVHRHLRRLLENGELVVEGSGPARRYRRPTSWTKTYGRKRLEEDVVWREAEASGILGTLDEAARDILQYGFTEMLNNAIDHAKARQITVRLESWPDWVVFEITDDGIGAFRNVRENFSLEDDLGALQELSKGKTTTAPERHTGEGIFFTSKAVSVFALESGTTRWIVDNERGEPAILDVPARKGTSVRCEVARTGLRPLAEIFDAYTRDLSFTVTRTTVKLFEHGKRFVSRSEAKRLSRGLEKFEEVIVDFKGVLGVGQGFCDELFRVWAKAHPGTKLVPVEMGRTVAFLVDRARGERS